ncbi:MAG: hypothetical protein [Olavius algarvensis Delta 4 endosymbiont]|nr:MAG: hypothetical protein [Olavius algarvensis Delta 4 endosymbiont]
MQRVHFIVIVLFLVTPSKGIADMFAGYDAFCGLPVVVGPNPQMATAETDRIGRKFIHIDPRAMSNWTNSRIFVLAHECAHHRLGHTSSMGKLERFSGGTARQELAADCWAAKKLRQIGYEFDISRTILQHASRGHFSANGYPSGNRRARNILNCIGERPCRTVMRECRHPAHPRGDRVPCSHKVRAHPNGDLYPCQHPCPGPYGMVPCHPRGDLYPCKHIVTAHRFDLIPCTHPAHPAGHPDEVCD